VFGSSLRVGRFFGIEVRIDASWLVIALLFGWVFYAQYMVAFPDLDQVATILLATASVIVFFASVVLHELSHSVVARKLGILVEGITLFLFGGVTTTRMDARQPRDEFLVAVVGPLTSLALAGAAWLVVRTLDGFLPAPILFGVGYLGWLNLLLGVFNLLPGFPLDGGRVLRSILWRATGSLARATRRAAAAGRAIAAVLIAFGIFVFLGGNFGGLWMAAIGWFLFQAASAADQDMVMRVLLKDIRAADLMSPDLVTIPAAITIQEAIDDYFLRYDHSAFPVADLDQPGMITLRSVREVPPDQRGRRQVWTVMTRLDDVCTVTVDATMDEVMELLREHKQDRVLVVDGDHIRGIITPRDVLRWVRRSEELGMTETGV
jgi:Zn-dependent protease/predicted transcriptional regulator